MMIHILSISSQTRHNIICEKPEGSQRLITGLQRMMVSLVRCETMMELMCFGAVLHLRVATVGAQEHLLACTEELLYRVVDLSGARGAVRNWARFFDQADAILFIVDSSSYNVPSAVNRDSNKLADALALFTETVSHPLLSRIGLLVFFNKSELCLRQLLGR